MTLSNSLLDFFISSAHAAEAGTATPPAQGGGFSLLLIMVVFVVFMYMTVWRPQTKKAKEHKDLLSSLAKGDEIVTAGGILGKVSKLTDTYVVISIADNTEITLQKSSISSVLPKGTMKTL